jgi:threonine dehydrogenase-like Zn-dependent dehydrogenase
MDEADVALKPKNLSMETAASIPLVGLTAWQVLVERAKLKKGQKVLIHAGSGGVGTFAIQLAKHLGATVATTTSTANIELVKRLGADVVIDYKKEDFAKVPVRLRHRPEQPGQRNAQEIPDRVEAWRQADLDLRSARCSVRQGGGCPARRRPGDLH